MVYLRFEAHQYDLSQYRAQEIKGDTGTQRAETIALTFYVLLFPIETCGISLIVTLQVEQQLVPLVRVKMGNEIVNSGAVSY